MPASNFRPVLAIAFCGVAASAAAGERALRSETMPFRDCLALIDEIAAEFGGNAVRIGHTRDGRSARIEAADGVVTLACSRIEETVTLTRSAG